MIQPMNPRPKPSTKPSSPRPLDDPISAPTPPPMPIQNTKRIRFGTTTFMTLTCVERVSKGGVGILADGLARRGLNDLPASSA
jgi:hypothetical protein